MWDVLCLDREIDWLFLMSVFCLKRLVVVKNALSIIRSDVTRHVSVRSRLALGIIPLSPHQETLITMPLDKKKFFRQGGLFDLEGTHQGGFRQ